MGTIFNMAKGISKYFSLNDMVATNVAPLAKKNAEDAVPYLQAITDFCKEVLDQAREALGGPLYVSSGFRGQTLNKAVGGLPASKHTLGWAADVYQPGWTWDKCLDAAHVICAHFEEKRIKADVITEQHKDGRVWIHIERSNGLHLFTGINKVYTEIPF